MQNHNFSQSAKRTQATLALPAESFSANSTNGCRKNADRRIFRAGLHMMKVGFIGLGVQGKYLAINLAEAGYDLMAYDLRPEPLMRSLRTAQRKRSRIEKSARMLKLSAYACSMANRPSTSCLGQTACWQRRNRDR